MISKRTIYGESYSDLDPVLERSRLENSRRKTPSSPKIKTDTNVFQPSLSKRVTQHCNGAVHKLPNKYQAPRTRKEKLAQAQRRKELEDDLNFCVVNTSILPTPTTKVTKLEIRLQAPSAELQHNTAVTPRIPSAFSNALYPAPPDRGYLTMHAPKSGTFVNLSTISKTKRRKKKTPIQERSFPDTQNLELSTIQELGEEEDFIPPIADTYLTTQFRKKVEQLSRDTSFRSNDYKIALPSPDDEEEVVVPKKLPKYEKVSRITKKGTLENFSFTKLKQPTLKQFYYGVRQGTIHCGDEHFVETARKRQGMCMPIAAYCFSILKHPDRWIQSDVDDVLEAGNELFLDSVKSNHFHKGEVLELAPEYLLKYCKLKRKKARFVVDEPEVSGLIRSADPTVYNITKGLKVFFSRRSAGILKMNEYCIGLWKDKHFYMFDANPRCIDLTVAPNGTAVMANLYDIASVVTVLLNRSALENPPFQIYPLSVYNILDKDAEEVNSVQSIPELDSYRILDAERAIVSGSFDVGDKCFGFSRNKQALCVSTVALIYGRITPPSAWHRKIIDKILIIGNQLFLECIAQEEIEAVTISILPSIFTMGSYTVELFIIPNRLVDLLYKKGQCTLNKHLEEFFAMNSSALLEIEGATIAIWEQRGMYHCFDPYSRTNEGLKCSQGAACASMHSTLDSLIGMITYNYDEKKSIFHLHALKVCNIQKSGRRRGLKKITVDLTNRAAAPIDDQSVNEVDSNVRSLGDDETPHMIRHWPSRSNLRCIGPVVDVVADLDSPSLSDTQIDPPPFQIGDDLLDKIPDLTLDELELEKRNYEEELHQQQEGEDWFEAVTNFTQVGSQSLQSEVVLEMDFELLPKLPRIIPKKIKRLTNQMELDPDGSVDMFIDDYRMASNYQDVPDGNQIICGTKNMIEFGSDLEFMAPFVCIMASVVARKYLLQTWSLDIVDYVLKCGAELHFSSDTRYDQVYKLEIPRISLGRNDFSVHVEHVFDGYLKPKILEKLIYKVSNGILVTPTYSCAIFTKNHLFYLFDGFGNNEVGLGKGPRNEGNACIMRFQNVTSLIARVLHNKAKRELSENIEYNRFVFSECTVKSIDQLLDEEPEDQIPDGMEDDENKSTPPHVFGYQKVDGSDKIQGTKALQAKQFTNILQEDFFACFCSCLFLLNCPLKKWDQSRIDQVLDTAHEVYSTTPHLKMCGKMFIQHIIVDDYSIDVSIKRIQFPSNQSKRTISAMIHTMQTKKHEHFILQLPKKCFAVRLLDGFHLFDPSDASGNAAWCHFTSLRQLSDRIGVVGTSYEVFIFEVTSIGKAPKPMVVSTKLHDDYRKKKREKLELVGKPFNEELEWLDVEPIPWSWYKSKEGLKKWHHWNVEMKDDLFSLGGPKVWDTHCNLANLVVALGMMGVYGLEEWSEAVMESILVYGAKYFEESVKDIRDQDYEIGLEDLKEEFHILPYKFEVEMAPIVEGTMFLVRQKQFNLYKALRFFFDGFEKRLGILYISRKHSDKRQYSFGKLRDGEYFIYDCSSRGAPMFADDAGFPYILRATTLNRLVHVMTLTLRAGDFYIYEVSISQPQILYQN